METNDSEIEVQTEAPTPPVSLNAKLCLGSSISILALGLLFTTGIGDILLAHWAIVLSVAAGFGAVITILTFYPAQLFVFALASANLGYWYFMTFGAKNVTVPPFGVAVILVAEVIVAICYASHFRPKSKTPLAAFGAAYIAVVVATFLISLLILTIVAATNISRKEAIALKSYTASSPNDDLSHLVVVEGSRFSCSIADGKPVCNHVRAQ
jgi:hypothetical protein